jgi:transposase
MITKTELLDDIPLIIAFCQRLNLCQIIDSNFNTHGNHQGLSNGELVLVWITYMLTKGNHRKAPVQDWSHKHRISLEALIGKKISDTDFDDCRLGRLLEKFAVDECWHKMEAAFYKDSFSILNLDTSAPKEFIKSDSSGQEIRGTIKIDSTTTYGHHKVEENNIMQQGWSKDHRPDLPQLKLMVSVEGKTGFQIATDTVPGNRNDDILYIPIIERTRKIIDTKNCLLCGDSKMSNMVIKANIVENNEYYLTPLQLRSKEKELLRGLLEQIVNGNQEAGLIYDTPETDNQKNRIIGAGFEVIRDQSWPIQEGSILWKERVLLIRSFDHAKQEINRLEKSLKKIELGLSKLTSKLCHNKEMAEEDLIHRAREYLKTNEITVENLFEFDITCDFEQKLCKRGETRNGKKREGTYSLKKYRAVLNNVIINRNKFDEIVRKIGWRMYVTNAPTTSLNFSSAYRYYRKTMYVVEMGFHVIKDHFNISPLFVRDEDQIKGMTRILTLALKVLTLLTAELKGNMKKENKILVGLYAGQPARKHPSPTAQSILEYFVRQEITLVGFNTDDRWYWEITSFNDKCREILNLLKIPIEVYTSLPQKINRANLCGNEMQEP